MAGDFSTKCQYKTGKCFKERTRKRNGEVHSLCEEHRLKQNMIQRRSDRKYQSVHAVRRKERSERKALLKKQALNPTPFVTLPTVLPTLHLQHPISFASPVITRRLPDVISPAPSAVQASGLLRRNKISTAPFEKSWRGAISQPFETPLLPSPTTFMPRDLFGATPDGGAPEAWTDDDVQLLHSLLLV
ncbi:hypothetical protein ACHHYP_08514 [Achlya hypogyna]|uniref:Uncharacterized protein n=1 Tax=Achlya hypogyna TaxID=1202772 RepID=A0A1V9YPB4_ACHHY|nr:hypothetical protein ACHHYP_08514 [Achlya hypogyna]